MKQNEPDNTAAKPPPLPPAYSSDDPEYQNLNSKQVSYKCSTCRSIVLFSFYWCFC